MDSQPVHLILIPVDDLRSTLSPGAVLKLEGYAFGPCSVQRTQLYTLFRTKSMPRDKSEAVLPPLRTLASYAT